jgi:conjugal transfer mating pair stabilization protein TraG
MIATARANAMASINSSFLTMGKVAEQALPLVRNVIEAIIYAVFPFVFLLFLLAQGRGLGLALKSFVLSLVWIQLWPPLYAILNYVATLASAKNLEAAARMGASTQGLALETASSIYHGAISDQAVAGYMVISIPIIATAIIKGGEVAFQAVTGVGPMQSAVSGESSATSKGNVTQDSVSIDQQQLAPNRSSAFMSTTSNAHGSTIQGSGPDAGVFRYQATLSRLATTFTFSERQATTLSENARESETLARTERDSMQRSQSAALTNALGIQDSFDRSQQRSGASTTSDGGSTSTQLQKLNSVAREVNRRLGLGEESTVGKSVVASATAGVKIPLTEIGGQATREGRYVDQERLTSAYDYARKAVETSQLSEATALVKEFRSSDAYQWARGSRTTGTSGFDSSYREAADHQSASENAYGRSKELTRAAQFMSEWSSGAQTDFTNYAARRLSERGLLREDDPIKLQRAVTEIAFGYAKGGDVGSQFVPGDSPLAPSRPLPQLLGWDSSTLRDDFNKKDASRNVDTVRDQAATNSGVVRNDQSRQRVEPGQSVGNDLAARVRTKESGAATTIDTRRSEVSQEQGALSENYNATVQVDKVSPNHSGNKAVWDTVGAQNDNRAKLGTPSERPSIGEWHLDKNGVPVAGPTSESREAAASPNKPDRPTSP